MKCKKVMLIYPAWSVFVKTDFEILSGKYTVTPYHFRPAKGAFRVLREFLRQFLFLLMNFRSTDIYYIWFADQHSLLPVMVARLTGKKCFLVVGGYDVCRIPSLNYGVFCSKPRGFAARWSMRHASLNLPVSEYVARKVRAIAPNSAYNTLYNCVNLQPGQPPAQERPYILTVAFVDTERTYYIKGIDLFVETARLLPQYSFLIIGFQPEKLKHLSDKFPPNLNFLPPVKHEALGPYFLKSRIYCQLSRSESFGIALAESILHGCIPLVTNEGGMPEVVGDRQYIVRKKPEEIAHRLTALFLSDDKKTSFVIQRIRQNFSVELRKERLLGILPD
jgi:glycosyltransferase involved in cell wall biosynthesis